MTTIFEIPLASVSLDPQLQPRIGGVDPEHVGELELVPEHWPPLKVVKRGSEYLLVDGFHRLTAAKNLGLERILVEVLQVPEHEDLHALAFELNASHGRPLTLADRRAFAARLLETHAEWSNREVSRQSGLAQATVAKVRQELEGEARIEEVSSRVGRDGRSYSVKERSSETVTFGAALDNVLTALDRTGRWRITRYLQKLADLLEEQDDLDEFQTIDDASQACLAVLGDEAAKELADRLAWSAGNIVQIAAALGYHEDDKP